MALTKAQGKFSQAIDDGADATAITIDSSERVGIGTTGPNQLLTLGSDTGSATIGLDFETTTVSRGSILYNAGAGEMAFTSGYSGYGGYMTFDCNGAERMRIDASGNLFVGTTDTTLYLNSGSGNGGIALSMPAAGAGRIDVARAGNLMTLNRLASDGEMMELYKDGGLIGQVNSYYGDIAFGNGDTGLLFNSGSDQISPFNVGTNSARHNAIDLGASGSRFHGAYVVNGVTAGSDEREKQEIAELDEAETRVAVACKGLLRKWRWKDAVEAKDNNPDSDEVARIHFGIIAQELKAAFEAEGLDAGRYGMFMHDTWTDEETGEERDRMGIRYSELLAFIIAAI